jgi:hypothetical protein
MNPDHPNDDLVARALEALLATPGPNEPPARTMQQVRREIAARQAMPTAGKAASTRRHDRVSWLALAMTILLLLAAGWTVGFHRALLSRVAGEQVSPDGTVCVFLSDGRVEFRTNGGT